MNTKHLLTTMLLALLFAACREQATVTLCYTPTDSCVPAPGTQDILDQRLQQYGIDATVGMDSGRLCVTIPQDDYSDSLRARHIDRLLSARGEFRVYETYNIGDLAPCLDALVANVREVDTCHCIQLFAGCEQSAPTGQVGMIKLNRTPLDQGPLPLLADAALYRYLPDDVLLAVGYAPIDANLYPLYALRCSGVRSLARGECYVPQATRVERDMGNRPCLNIVMNDTDARRWEQQTQRNVGRALAMVIDGVVYCAPLVNGPISGGLTSISASFSEDEAAALAAIIAHPMQRSLAGGCWR